MRAERAGRCDGRNDLQVTPIWRDHCKRSLDLAVAGVAGVLLAPVALVVAAAIYSVLGRPVLFRQTRPGLEGRPFVLVKFRTMSLAPEGAFDPRYDGQRLGRLGRILRATSLDELPELWNVLRGEMSLVGPRPLLMQYLDRYEPWQARRHEVKPGMTGWAQINGRNAVSWDEKFRLDVWYVDHMSFWLDVKILAMTVLKVLRREGITAAGSATMPEFRGKTE